MKFLSLPKSFFFGAILSTCVLFAHLPAVLADNNSAAADDPYVSVTQDDNGHTKSMRQDQMLSVTLYDASMQDDGTNYWTYTSSLTDTLQPIMKQYSEIYSYDQEDPTSMTPIYTFGQRSFYFNLLKTGRTVLMFTEHNPADTDGLNDQVFMITLNVTAAAPTASK